MHNKLVQCDWKIEMMVPHLGAICGGTVRAAYADALHLSSKLAKGNPKLE